VTWPVSLSLQGAAADAGKVPILDDGKSALVSLYGAERLTKNGLPPGREVVKAVRTRRSTDR
jgi:hypothetical protein